jgi:hypothetical protein
MLQLWDFVNIYRTVPPVTLSKHYLTWRVTSSSMLLNVDWWILLTFRKNVTHTKGKTVQEYCSLIALPPKRRWFTNRQDVTSQKTRNTATRTSGVAVTCSPQPPALWGKMLRFHNPENAYWRYWIVSSTVRCKGWSCLVTNGHSCSHIFIGF